jgi:hypothetical protein
MMTAVPISSIFKNRTLGAVVAVPGAVYPPDMGLLDALRRRLRRRRLNELYDAEALRDQLRALNAPPPDTIPGRVSLPNKWMPGQRDGTS